MPRPNIRRPQQAASKPNAMSFRKGGDIKRKTQRKMPKGYADGIRIFHT